MKVERRFPRAIDSIGGVFELTSMYFARHRVDPRLLTTVDLVLEELFTNMVKYGVADRPDSEILVEMESVGSGVEVAISDFGVDRFDMTAAPDAATSLPLEERTPGGLGIHLSRRLVDEWRYEYDPVRRASRITFRKTAAGTPAPAEKPMTRQA